MYRNSQTKTVALLLIGSTLFFISHLAISKNTYVDNQSCVQCHVSEAKQWQSSHHAHAMAKATPETVLGNFNNTEFKHHGVISRFFKRDNKFFVRTEGPDGKYADFEIKYTLGISPLQQYLIELPNGRVQNFTIAWDVLRKKWFDLYPNEKTPPGNVFHWAGRYQTTNMMCLSCHTTNLQKNYDAIHEQYKTTWSEINVSCQSCHGPGEEHVKWGQSKGKDKLIKPNYNIKNMTETCAVCHSRRSELTAHPSVGEPLMNHYLPTLLDDGLYYPDGQQQAEVYVYQSFLQSKMYQRGVNCVDCHQPHTGQLKFEGNIVCTQCHSPQGDTRFPLTAKLYDDPSHHHHKMGSSGAACVSCHMPAKKYMIINARPDHNIRIPRPDLSIRLKTPNACTNCHTNKSAQWAVDIMNQWYGSKWRAEKHYGEVIAAGRAMQAEGQADLLKLINNLQASPIVRATALSLLHNYGEAGIATSKRSIQSEDPMIRRAAIANLEQLPSSARITLLAPLLGDPIRAVRIEAARVLSSIALDQFDDKQRVLFKVALAEFEEAQNQSLDMPAANLNFGVLYENKNKPEQAEYYYLNALSLDADFTPARLNLARLYSRLNRQHEAETILRAGIVRQPNQGELMYSLGLLLAEENHLKEAVTTLGKAANLLPHLARVRYNYALGLQQLGDRQKARVNLLQAQRLDPHDFSIVMALTISYIQDKNWPQASKWAEKLQKLNPGSQQVQQILGEIQQTID